MSAEKRRLNKIQNAQRTWDIPTSTASHMVALEDSSRNLGVKNSKLRAQLDDMERINDNNQAIFLSYGEFMRNAYGIKVLIHMVEGKFDRLEYRKTRDDST